jgi:hypothetical protein
MLSPQTLVSKALYIPLSVIRIGFLVTPPTEILIMLGRGYTIFAIMKLELLPIRFLLWIWNCILIGGMEI